MARIKGFFLSTDSIFSLVIISSVFSLLVFPQQYSEPESTAFAAISREMRDLAVIGFYSGKTPKELGLKNPSSFTKEHWSCREEILAQVETSPFNNKPDFEKHSYCGEGK